MSKRNRSSEASGSDTDTDTAKLDFLTQLSDDLVVELCTRIPMRKLVQCMSVSKSWHSIIHRTLSDESYLRRSPGVLVGHNDYFFYYCSLGQVHEAEQFSKPYNFNGALRYTDIVKGLVCGCNINDIFICNIWSGEKRQIPGIPGNEIRQQRILFRSDFFFGFDPINGLHKLLATNWKKDGRFRCYILTLGESTCSWRELDSSSNMPKSFRYQHRQTFMVDGVFYWLALGREIIGFNFNEEKFISIQPPKMDESRLRSYKFTQFKGRLAMYYTADRNLIIHTLDDDKGLTWTKTEFLYSNDFRCPLCSRVVLLPSDDILLVNEENQGGDVVAYSYNYHNHKFEKFLVGKLPYVHNISCVVPNFRKRYQ